MDVIKSVLKEELSYALKAQQSYQQALEDLPKGSLSKKRIHRKDYYYLLYRAGSEVKTQYVGPAGDEKIRDLKEKIAKRKQYQQIMKALRQQIKYLEKALHVRAA